MLSSDLLHCTIYNSDTNTAVNVPCASKQHINFPMSIIFWNNYRKQRNQHAKFTLVTN